MQPTPPQEEIQFATGSTETGLRFTQQSSTFNTFTLTNALKHKRKCTLQDACHSEEFHIDLDECSHSGSGDSTSLSSYTRCNYTWFSYHLDNLQFRALKSFPKREEGLLFFVFLMLWMIYGGLLHSAAHCSWSR